MPNQIHVPNHLILPFGTAKMLDLDRIKLSSVAANGIYFTSDIPCVYIDRSKNEPLTFCDFRQLFGYETEPDGTADDVPKGLNFIHGLIRKHMPNPTQFEVRYLELYFQWLHDLLSDPHSTLQPGCIYNALIPIPEMQLYVHDPLEPGWQYEPTNNFRVDFGFWTGTRIVAVEIDGHEPEGYASDVRRDRLLRRAGIDLIHVLNREILQHGKRVISHLLPEDVSYAWRRREAPVWPPFL